MATGKTSATSSCNAEEASVLSFYPNRGYVVKVRVLDSEPIFATTDLGTANFERRHMVDSMFLRLVTSSASADGGLFSLDNLVEPTPPVKRIWGTRNDSDQVLGMLPRRLASPYIVLGSHPGVGSIQVAERFGGGSVASSFQSFPESIRLLARR